MTPFTYAGYQLALMPPWLQGFWGERWATGFGTLKDVFVEGAIQAVECRWLATCPEDALQYIGLERLMPQNPGESMAAYRARLKLAWLLWPFVGTKQGILTALGQLGFSNVTIKENIDWTYPPSPAFAPFGTLTVSGATNTNPISITSTAHGLSTGKYVTIAGVGGNTAANGSWYITVVDANTFTIPVAGNGAYTAGGTIVAGLEWWRFWVIISQPNGFGPPIWRIGDGSVVGTSLRIGFSFAPASYPAIRPTINLWKPAHEILMNIIVILSGSIVGGDWHIGDGTVVGGSAALI